MRVIQTVLGVIIVVVTVSLIASGMLTEEKTAYQKICERQRACKANELRLYCESFNFNPEDVAAHKDTWAEYEKWNRSRLGVEETVAPKGYDITGFEMVIYDIAERDEQPGRETE